MKIEQPENQTSLLTNNSPINPFDSINDLHQIISNLRLIHTPPYIDRTYALSYLIKQINPTYQPPTIPELTISTQQLIDKLLKYLASNPSEYQSIDLNLPVRKYLSQIDTLLKGTPIDTSQIPQFWTEKNYTENLRPWILVNNRLRPRPSGTRTIA